MLAGWVAVGEGAGGSREVQALLNFLVFLWSGKYRCVDGGVCVGGWVVHYWGQDSVRLQLEARALKRCRL